MKRFNTTIRNVLNAIPAIAAALFMTAGAYAQTAKEAPPPASEAHDKELPSADELYDRHIEAMGGEAAIRKVTSRAMSGVLQIPSMSLEGPIVAYAAAPNKMFLTIDMSSMGMGEQKQGFDGRVAWAIDPMRGETVFEGEMYKQLRRDANFYQELNVEELFDSIRTVGREEFDGKSAYKVERMSNGRPSYAYFDADTGLMIGQRAVEKTEMGDIAMLMVINEYTEVDGVQVPTKSSITQGGVEMVLTFTEITHNKVDPAVFALPPAIAAKAAGQPADADDDKAIDDDAGNDDDADKPTDDGEGEDGDDGDGDDDE